MKHEKRFWTWVAIAVVLIVLAICVIFWNIHQAKKAAVESAVVADVPAGQLPGGFPSNIPIEKGALIVSNFNAAIQNGQFQATRSFNSFKTVAQNISLYASFLANPANGWAMAASSTDSSGDMTMVARDDKGLLTIRVSPLPPQPMPASLVEITFVTNPTSAGVTPVVAPVTISPSVPLPKPASVILPGTTSSSAK
jgi:hypothetical protein